MDIHSITKIEESKIMETLEQFRQLIYKSSMSYVNKKEINADLDYIRDKINLSYVEKHTDLKDRNENVGNIIEK